MKSLIQLAFAFLLLIILSCTSDMVQEAEECQIMPTYNNDARSLIVNKCAFSGCHDGASGVGNYTSYQGIQRDLENGGFRREVLEARTMPQSGELTSDEFELLRCWAENLFPE